MRPREREREKDAGGGSSELRAEEKMRTSSVEKKKQVRSDGDKKELKSGEERGE